MQYLLLFHCNDGCMNSPQYYVTRVFSPAALRPNEGQVLLILDVSRSHSLDAPQSVGLLWTSDQLVAETSTWQHTTLTTDKHPCPRRDSIPQSQQASGRRPTPQTARPLGSVRYKYLMSFSGLKLINKFRIIPLYRTVLWIKLFKHFDNQHFLDQPTSEKKLSPTWR